MKLILANNQSPKFTDFYAGLQSQAPVPFEYAGYRSLLFVFDTDAERRLDVVNLESGKHLMDYDGVYINGYLNTYELAAATAVACESCGVGFVNREMHNAPSLSKLSMYAKLAAAGVRLPSTIGGTKHALSTAAERLTAFAYPAVLKRADADRGIDNFKVAGSTEVSRLLDGHADLSLWLLQEYVDNQGFYLVSFYDQKPAFGIFRSLQARPDNNQQKAHMYKPAGGINATLLKPAEVPPPILEACGRAVKAMDRQIASVDCLYGKATQKVHILEVNYNPQLVTIETFKSVRVQAFLDNLPNIGM